MDRVDRVDQLFRKNREDREDRRGRPFLRAFVASCEKAPGAKEIRRRIAPAAGVVVWRKCAVRGLP